MVDEGVITFDKRLERVVDCEVFSSVSVGRDGKILVSAVIDFDSEGFVLSFIIVVLLFIVLLYNIFSVRIYFLFASLHKKQKKKKKN